MRGTRTITRPSRDTHWRDCYEVCGTLPQGSQRAQHPLHSYFSV
jgi:hypothetical protein